jgi:hypothetical protein
VAAACAIGISQADGVQRVLGRMIQALEGRHVDVAQGSVGVD